MNLVEIEIPPHHMYMHYFGKGTMQSNWTQFYYESKQDFKFDIGRVSIFNLFPLHLTWIHYINFQPLFFTITISSCFCCSPLFLFSFLFVSSSSSSSFWLGGFE